MGERKATYDIVRTTVVQEVARHMLLVVRGTVYWELGYSPLRMDRVQSKGWRVLTATALDVPGERVKELGTDAWMR